MNNWRQALARFEAAVRADAWKGAQHPDDISEIEAELKAARLAMEAKLKYRKLKNELDGVAE